MSKYKPLCDFLKKAKEDKVCLTRAEIEKILGFKLPGSSRIKQWWSNDPWGGHTQSFAWIEAGFIVDTTDDEIIFLRR